MANPLLSLLVNKVTNNKRKGSVSNVGKKNRRNSRTRNTGRSSRTSKSVQTKGTTAVPTRIKTLSETVNVNELLGEQTNPFIVSTPLVEKVSITPVTDISSGGDEKTTAKIQQKTYHQSIKEKRKQVKEDALKKKGKRKTEEEKEEEKEKSKLEKEIQKEIKIEKKNRIQVERAFLKQLKAPSKYKISTSDPNCVIEFEDDNHPWIGYLFVSANDGSYNFEISNSESKFIDHITNETITYGEEQNEEDIEPEYGTNDALSNEEFKKNLNQYTQDISNLYEYWNKNVKNNKDLALTSFEDYSSIEYFYKRNFTKKQIQTVLEKSNIQYNKKFQFIGAADQHNLNEVTVSASKFSKSNVKVSDLLNVKTLTQLTGLGFFSAELFQLVKEAGKDFAGDLTEQLINHAIKLLTERSSYLLSDYMSRITKLATTVPVTIIDYSKERFNWGESEAIEDGYEADVYAAPIKIPLGQAIKDWGYPLEKKIKEKEEEKEATKIKKFINDVIAKGPGIAMTVSQFIDDSQKKMEEALVYASAGTEYIETEMSNLIDNELEKIDTYLNKIYIDVEDAVSKFCKNVGYWQGKQAVYVYNAGIQQAARLIGWTQSKMTAKTQAQAKQAIQAAKLEIMSLIDIELL